MGTAGAFLRRVARCLQIAADEAMMAYPSASGVPGLIPTKEALLMSIKANALPQYLGSGDPALKDYYPPWLDNMADDATVEGSMLDGVVQGAEAVRSVVLTIRSLYDRQGDKFPGPYSNNGFLEDYVAEVHGEPTASVGLGPYNAALSSH